LPALFKQRKTFSEPSRARLCIALLAFSHARRLPDCIEKRSEPQWPGAFFFVLLCQLNTDQQTVRACDQKNHSEKRIGTLLHGQS